MTVGEVAKVGDSVGDKVGSTVSSIVGEGDGDVISISKPSSSSHKPIRQLNSNLPVEI